MIITLDVSRWSRCVRKTIGVAIAALALVACQSSDWSDSPENGSPPPSGNGAKWVVAYYTSYYADRYPPDRIDWSGLTHLVVTRVYAHPTGPAGTLAVELDETLTHDLVRRAHDNGRKALLMVGGEGNGPIRAACADASRATFVRNLIGQMDKYGFDGLDLDWEEDIDYDRFVRWIDDLRAAKRGLILTAPGGVLNSNIDAVNPGAVQVANRVDLYSLMSYYPATAMTGWGWLSWHTSPLDGHKSSTPITIKDSLQRYVDAGVAKARLGMGVAFYAICYTGGITGPNQATDQADIVGGDNDFSLAELFGVGGDYANASSSSRQWDAQALASYLSLPAENRRGCRYVSFDDERSIIEKGRFTRDNGYGGIVVWNVNFGYLQNPPAGVQANFLMQALKRGFIDP